MRIRLKDTSIYYQSFGHGPKVALFFHGWAMSGDSWLPLVNRLPPEQWRAIVPDLRGFGRSDKPLSGYHIDDYMQDAIRLLRALKIPQVNLIGHSFGGTGALYLAARVPHLVRRVAVLDTIPGAASPYIDARIRQQFSRILALVNKVSDKSLPLLLDRIWRQSFLVPPSPDQQEAQHQFNQCAPRHALVETLHTILTTDISSQLHRIRKPTLVIRGEDDPVLHDAADGLDVIDAAQHVRIIGTGHYPQLENPDAVWPILSTFLGAP